MSNSFKFDKRAIERAIEPAIRDRARKFTRDYAAMGRRLEGKPLDEIKAELRRYHRSEGGEITDPDLTKYAELLQAGDTITFRYGGVKG